MILRTALLTVVFATRVIFAYGQPASHDGRHAFDFQFGTWRVHTRRLMQNGTKTPTWVTYEGTHVVDRVWNGRANLGVLEADGAGKHIEGLSLRTYDPQTRQWSFTFAESGSGTLGAPMTGDFQNDRGVFYSQEIRNGRPVFGRSITSDITPVSYRDEYAFSSDGGRNWHTDWIATYTRTKASQSAEATAAPASRDAQSRAFDFNIGSWRTHIRDIHRSSNGAPISTPLTGTVVIRTIWGGAALLEELKADGPTEHIEGITLYLYNPNAHQWSQTFVDLGDGSYEPSMIGAFANGRGSLISQEPYNGKMALVRGVWSHISANGHRFAQYYSDDAGRTWHPAFIADLTRIAP